MRVFRIRARHIGFVVTLSAGIWPVGFTTAGDMDRAIDLVLRQNEAAAQTQKRVESADDKTKDLLAEYRGIQQQIESLKLYNNQLDGLVNGQRAQIEELQGRIDKATMIGREITPLMLRMIDVLGEFVELDVSFLLNERRDRIKQLHAMMQRPDVTEAEKFRRILEAYQIENEYGRTIETYRGKLSGDANGEGRTVSFLRIGRVSLVYETIDGQEMGAWNAQTRKWEPLGPEHKSSIKKGMRIAQKQAAPDLFRIPVSAATKSEAK